MVFDGNKITPESYHAQVGIYISLILQSCSSPIICLVASKMDLAREGLLRREKKLDFVLEYTKEQIKFLIQKSSMKQKIFLYEKVLTFSSKKPRKHKLEEISGIFLSILSNKDFVTFAAESVPYIWNMLRNEMTQNEESEMDISDIALMLSEIEEKSLPESDIQVSKQ